MRFQSTRPAWGRDTTKYLPLIFPLYFNPRASHGGATGLTPKRLPSFTFQSTRPAWGRDILKIPYSILSANFNPRAPHGGAGQPYPNNPSGNISIHAPRMGARPPAPRPSTSPHHFNPRAPHGGAPSPTPLCAAANNFNPRARVGRDAYHFLSVHSPHISIHAPAWGAT